MALCANSLGSQTGHVCRSKCEKTVINTTKYLLDSVGGKLVTTTCFGHRVAIVGLYTLK